MSDIHLEGLRAAQETYFRTGATRSYDARRLALVRLSETIASHEDDILEALRLDLGKPAFEGWGSEIGLVRGEIDHALSHLKAWMKPEKVSTPLVLKPSTSRILREPLGRCLIIGPWNYPFMLVIAPLVSALAAGNTALLKPSELTPHTSSLIERMIRTAFSSELVGVVTGEGKATVAAAFEKFAPHFVFFTGSPAVGRKIAIRAAQSLTPVVLELGGKSPAIVDGSTPLEVTAKRLLFAKFLNAGQTCVAPDYLVVRRDHVAPLVKELGRQLDAFYGPDPLKSKDLARIVNHHHFERLKSLLQQGRIVYGGSADLQGQRICPSILLDVDLNAPVMQEEIFGPILPVVPYDDEEDLFATLDQNPDPLAFYIFSEERPFVERMLTSVRFGGGAVNNAAVHFSNPHLPFGGVGGSGFGSYHGHYGFETFSHKKSILDSGTWFDPSFKYPPYSDSALQLLKKVM